VLGDVRLVGDEDDRLAESLSFWKTPMTSSEVFVSRLPVGSSARISSGR
jgi:hypothetical protein